MARLARDDWGYAEFEREARPLQQPAPSLRPRPVAAPAKGTVHVGAWLSAVAICLLGLVALHVGLLKKNMEYNDLVREKNSLTADNAKLSAEVATLSSPERIEQIALNSLGMVSPDKVKYVYIGPAGATESFADLAAGPSDVRTAAP